MSRIESGKNVENIAEALRELGDTGTVVCTGGFVIGVLFGWLGETSRFCMRAAVAEWTLDNRQDNPVRSTEYVTAMLASLLAVQLLMLTTNIDFDQSIYRSSPFRPMIYIIGGALFGIGMVLAGGCVSRMLILGASGNLRSLFTLIILAISSYATSRGIFAYMRVGVESLAEFSGPVRTWDGLLGLSPQTAAFVVSIPLLVALAIFVRRSGLSALLPGLGIGALVAAGWWLTGVVGADEFEPVPLASLTYTAPVGEGLQYLMTFSGSTLSFGVALIGGVMMGAFLSALIGGRFKVVGFQYAEAPLRYALGGFLMGFGGVMGLGCPMGQGITGTGTLTVGSFLTIISIAISAGLTYKIMGPMKSGPAPVSPS